MTATLDIFNDIVKILNSLVLMETSLSKAVSDSKEFITFFKDGKLEEAKAKMDSFSKDLGEFEKLFKDNTLEPAMDLYKQIKQLLHLHVANVENQVGELKKASSLSLMQNLLKELDGNRKASA